MAAVASGTGNIGDVLDFFVEFGILGVATCGQKCIVMALGLDLMGGKGQATLCIGGVWALGRVVVCALWIENRPFFLVYSELCRLLCCVLCVPVSCI